MAALSREGAEKGQWTATGGESTIHEVGREPHVRLSATLAEQCAFSLQKSLS